MYFRQIDIQFDRQIDRQIEAGGTKFLMTYDYLLRYTSEPDGQIDRQMAASGTKFLMNMTTFSGIPVNQTDR